MAKKLVDYAMASITIIFLIGAFSVFIYEADTNTNTTNIMQSTLNTEYDNLLNHQSLMETESTNLISSDTGLLPEENTFLETRGADFGGIASTGSKNILMSWINTASEIVPIHNILRNFLIALLIVGIGAAGTRMFFGQSRV